MCCPFGACASNGCNVRLLHDQLVPPSTVHCHPVLDTSSTRMGTTFTLPQPSSTDRPRTAELIVDSSRPHTHTHKNKLRQRNADNNWCPLIAHPLVVWRGSVAGMAEHLFIVLLCSQQVPCSRLVHLNALATKKKLKEIKILNKVCLVSALC